MTLLKGYLDSSVLISYLWWSRSRAKPSRRAPAGMARAINAGAFEPVISRFCLMEVSSHFRDYEILRLLIREGYGYRQFSQKRREFRLSKAMDRKVRLLAEDLAHEKRFTVLNVVGLDDKAYEDIERYVEGYLGILDAFHLQVAVSSGCDYLVTGDEEFLQRVKDMADTGEYTAVTKVISPLELLKHPAVVAIAGKFPP